MYSQIIPLDFTVSDRWFYFPIVGLLGLIGIFLTRISLSKKMRDIGMVLGIAFLLFLSARTIIRNTNWVDNMTLFTHDNKIVENYDIENNIGSEYFNRHNYSQALVHYKKSFMLFPYELNTFNVGVTYESLGNMPEAKKYYVMVIQQKKFFIDIQYKQLSYEALGKIYTFREGPTQNSLAFVKKGLKIYPDSGYLWADLAYTDDVFHKYDEALAAAAKAESLLPVPQTSYIYNQILNKRKIDFKQL